jgi:type IX secretion system PorP/SprF family membrane protein
MRKKIALFALLSWSVLAQAQQDPMFTNYLFNALTFNPAYAGSNEHLTINALNRNQWVGIDGAPVTQTVTIHTPLKGDKVGLGFSLVNDKIGPTNTLDLAVSYAYRIPVGKNAKLSIGLQGSYNNNRSDWSQLTIQSPDDAFKYNISSWKPNFGAGIYYYSKHFYTGIAVPRFLENTYITASQSTLPLQGKEYRHYYFTMGAAIPIRGDALIFKPSLLLKASALDNELRPDANGYTVGAPKELNIDLSLFFQQTLWIGTSFRTSIEAINKTSSFDSVDFWAAYYLAGGLRLGTGYDFSLTKIQQKSVGSFEVFLGYEFDFKEKKVVTPRYF